MTTKTIDQQIAEHQRKITALRQKAEKQKTREKILVGAVYLGMAEKNPAAAQRMISTLENIEWRDADRKIIDGLLTRLRSLEGDGQ